MNLLNKVWLSILYFFSKKELTPFLKASHHLKTFQERSDWFQRLIRWISWDRRPRKEFDDATVSAQASRLGFFIQVLEKHPEDRKAVGIQLWALLSESTSQDLFASAGLARERGFFTELASRLWQHLLPATIRENDLTQVFNLSFGAHASSWVEALPIESIEYLSKLIRESALDLEKPFPGLVDSISEALLILSAHIASVGVSPHVLRRSPNRAAHESAFVKFSQCTMRLSEELRSKGRVPAESVRAVESAAGECRQAIQHILEQVETAGVSVHLVYDLESLQSWKRRAVALVKMVDPSEVRSPLIIRFIADLARESEAKRSVTKLLQENIHILSRKIVERTGVSGEHYITKGIADWLKMLYQAMGGGILTAFTMIGKYWIYIQNFPLFFDGFFTGLNYAVSFVLIQFFHFTLGTKQPSMTAPSLAGKLLWFEKNDEVKPFIDEVARITRSQIISVVGNVGAVIPMALFLDKLWQMRVGHPILSVEYAEHALHSIDPIHSATILYAIFTGFILWASSICAGWLENWVVYENIPAAIAASRRLQMFIGKRGAAKVGLWFLKQSSGLGGNISLGFLLGYAGVFSKFFGLALEVRHVTLSTGTLAFAASALMYKGGFELRQLWLPGLGIFFIGFFNVTTSFLLALYVAARARNVRPGAVRFLLGRVFVTFLKSPGQFFFPTKAVEPSAEEE